MKMKERVEALLKEYTDKLVIIVVNELEASINEHYKSD